MSTIPLEGRAKSNGALRSHHQLRKTKQTYHYIACCNRSAYQSPRRFYLASRHLTRCYFLFRTFSDPLNHVGEMPNQLTLHYSLSSSLRSPLALLFLALFSYPLLSHASKCTSACVWGILRLALYPPFIYFSDPCHPFHRVSLYFLYEIQTTSHAATCCGLL